MGRCENLGLLFGAASREIHDPHILVFVNNIHERPLRSLPFVTTHSPSSKLCLPLACLRRRSWPITCLRCPLVFIARSPILVAFTARSSLIAVYSELLLTPVRPVPFGAASL